MRSLSRRGLAALLLLVSVAAPHARQALDRSQSAFHSTTDLVPVDVSVLDGNRHPVTDLTVADFRLLVDGKPQPIAAFSSIELPGRSPRDSAPGSQAGPPGDGAVNDLASEGRLVVILLDGSIPNGEPMIAAKRIARAAIEQLGPGDLAAVVRSTVFRDNGGSENFTNDRSRLLQAIESSAMGTTEPPVMGPTGLQAAAPVPGSLFQTQLQCQVIANIARQLQHAPRRRKLLLFVGSQLALGGNAEVGGERRDCRASMLGELTGANVTVHTIDPAGLLTATATAEHGGSASAKASQDWARKNQARLDNLRVLPELTGGRAVLNLNAPEAQVAAIFGESARYYLIGFVPVTGPADSREHTIRVQVKRSGVTVHSRMSFRITDVAVTGGNVGAARSPTAPAADISAAPLAPVPLSPSSTHVDLERLLTATGQYMATYEKALPAVVMHEDYRQTAASGLGKPLSRVTKAQMVTVDFGGIGWSSFRDVTEVDGRSVRMPTDRLIRLLGQITPNSLRQARAIAAESARYNLDIQGFRIDRTVNTPFIALMFLRQGNLARSTFERVPSANASVATLRFVETAMPRLIQSTGNRPVTGEVDVDLLSGRVERTALRLEAALDVERRLVAQIDVRYGLIPGLDMWLPISMTESYVMQPGRQRISGEALYSDWRRFSVDVQERVKER